MTLEQRLQRTEDIETIRQLKAAYCDACDDDHNGDKVAELFTADGLWQQAGGTAFSGRAEIAAHLFSIRQAKTMRRSSHMVSNPIIEIDGDEATGQWRFLMLCTAYDGNSFHRIIGRYQDTYRREQGHWRIRSLTAVVEERGRYEAEPSPSQ